MCVSFSLYKYTVTSEQAQVVYTESWLVYIKFQASIELQYSTY